MERKMVSGIMLILLLASVLTLVFNVQPAKTQPTTIIVPDDYPTIQAAINAANDGDTVFVRNGTYYEHLVVNKTLSLVGENSNTTVIDGSNATSPIVLIRAGNTSFTQFTILNASQGGEGIVAQDSPNISICSNIVKLTTFGIMVQGCSNAIIQSNTLTDNSGHGLEIDWSTTVAAVDNYIFGNRDEGIYAYDCQNCTLTGNFVSGNHWSGVLIQSGNGNMIINNTISNNDHVGGIWLFDGTTSNTVSGNTILNNSRGVYIGFWTTYYISPQGNLIVSNTLEGNSIGINIDYSNANAVYHNQIVGNDVQSTVKPGYSNVWDNGCEGNYWSDYNGTDSNGDGIGDTPYVIDANNTDNYPLMNPWSPPDIAVTNLTSAKTVIGQGYTGSINVTFENLGNKIEAFNTTVYANSTCILSEQTMLSITNYTLSFKWNTTGFAYGNYTLNAYAEPVPDETNIVNNNFTCAIPVHIGVPADVSGSTPGVYNGVCDMKDIAFLIAHFNGKPGDWKWDPNADVNDDNVINIKDIAIAVYYFNKRE